MASYAAGAKLGEDPQPVMLGIYTSPGNLYALNKLDGWTTASGQGYSTGAANGGFTTAANPDGPLRPDHHVPLADRQHHGRR